MILFVIIGAIILVKIYSQVVLPPDVQAIMDRVEREQRRKSSSDEQDLDLIENDIIDI